MHVTDLNTIETMQMREGFGVAFPTHSAAGTASTATVWMELEPGAVLPEHTDSAEEILLVTRGSVEATLGDETGTLSEGQMALVPALVPHGLRNAGDTPARVLGFFSASTNIGVFTEPLDDEGTQVVVIGAPVPMRASLGEPIAAAG
jgi:quercetin dioxygenase-like cupin family protein